MAFTKQGNFTKKVTDLPNTPSPDYTPAQIKEYFETPSNELKTTVNKLVDDLNADRWVDTNKIALQGVERSNIKKGAVGVNELDPSIINQPKTEFQIQAKFDSLDAHLAQIAINVQTYGVIGDGTDQTTSIQKLLNEYAGKRIYFPKPSNKYVFGSITIPSHTTLEFAEGSVCEVTSGIGEREQWINIIDVENVSIYANNVTFRMLKDEYTSGEWRHVFNIRGSKNIIIDSPQAVDSGGDGFYIGATENSPYSENITLLNPKADNNRRQGISIVSVKGLFIQNPICTNTKGTAPQAGIDIEPNNQNDELTDIVIDNPITKNNEGAGILIALNRFGGLKKEITITINNHKDEGSANGMSVADIADEIGKLVGKIVVNSPLWSNAKLNGFKANSYSANAPLIELNKPKIINPNTSNVDRSVDQTNGHGIVLTKVPTNGGSYCGNFVINEPFIIDNRQTPLITYGIWVRGASTSTKDMKNITIINPKFKGIQPLTKIYFYSEGIIEDGYRQVQDNRTGTINVREQEFAVINHNEGATANKNAYLSGSAPVGWADIVFEVRANYRIRIYPQSTDKIVPLNDVAGGYIESSVIGSRVKLRKTMENTWFVVEQVGVWTTGV